MLDEYRKHNLRKVFYEEKKDILDVFDENWKHLIIKYIYHSIHMDMTKQYVIMNLFQTVTKNLGLIYEIAQKLTLLQIHHEEKLILKMIHFVSKELDKKQQRKFIVPPIDSSLDQHHFFLQFVLFLQCNINDQTI